MIQFINIVWSVCMTISETALIKLAPNYQKNINLFNMEMVGLRRISNFILYLTFAQYLKVQSRNIFKTLPWSFSVKTHLYANYTVQCTPESVLLCIFPKPQQNS